MSDGSKVRVYDKQGRDIGPRSGQGASTEKMEVESRAAAYRRQKKGSREEWVGQHEATAKKIEAEEAEAAKKAGVKPGVKVDSFKPSEPFS